MYSTRRERLEAGEAITLYYATTPSVGEEIIKNEGGFRSIIAGGKEPLHLSRSAEGALEQGGYSAPERTDEYFFVFQCSVKVGRVKQVDPFQGDYTFHSLLAEGYDSLFIRDVNVYSVYNSDQVEIVHLFDTKKEESSHCATPGEDSREDVRGNVLRQRRHQRAETESSSDAPARPDVGPTVPDSDDNPDRLPAYLRDTKLLFTWLFFLISFQYLYSIFFSHASWSSTWYFFLYNFFVSHMCAVYCFHREAARKSFYDNPHIPRYMKNMTLLFSWLLFVVVFQCAYSTFFPRGQWLFFFYNFFISHACAMFYVHRGGGAHNVLRHS